jgi:hypothetical protein
VDEQRVAHQAILAAVRSARAGRGKKCVLVRGAPGTGKTVIAVQLLADALRLGWSAVHTTGGKAFTTVLKSKFRGANGLFASNLEYRRLPKDALDLGLVDEAHRVRETSDTFRTPKERRATRPQVDEILDACRVTVFLLDENQSVRPGEVGSTARVRSAARARGIALKEYDLAAQFRCGGCREYVAWVDALLSRGSAGGGATRGRTGRSSPTSRSGPGARPGTASARSGSTTRRGTTPTRSGPRRRRAARRSAASTARRGSSSTRSA